VFSALASSSNCYTHTTPDLSVFLATLTCNLHLSAGLEVKAHRLPGLGSRTALSPKEQHLSIGATTNLAGRHRTACRKENGKETAIKSICTRNATSHVTVLLPVTDL